MEKRFGFLKTEPGLNRTLKDYLRFVVSSFVGGFLFAIAGLELICLVSNNLFAVGALLHGFALLTCLYLNFNLFNSLVVDSLIKHKIRPFLELLLCLVFNVLASYITGLLARLTINNSDILDTAEQFVAVRIISFMGYAGRDWYYSLFSGLFCGLITSLGVAMFYRINNSILKVCTVFITVGIYVICGFENHLVNVFYATFANAWNPATAMEVFIVLIGNSLGCFAMYLLLRILKLKK